MTEHNAILFANDLTGEVVDWQALPEATPSLMPGTVHLWRVSLDGCAEATLRRFADSLSLDEQARASRYRFEIDRRRFVTGRGALRQLLAGYTAATPAELAFEYGRWGKPSLAGNKCVQFNVSHCRNLYLLAVGNCSPLGIDVEKLELPDEYLRIAADCFSSEQVQLLNECHQEQRAAFFFRTWTGLEAVCKMSGAPLSAADALGRHPSCLRHFVPATGHVAALAVAFDERDTGATAERPSYSPGPSNSREHTASGI